ncbi:MAG: ribosomal RNA small subunit methyltransferase A [Candidatus Omnitrophica bacterium]|nr:ribosomal RNA small subunit methyltransferase A [Candidatus Omnitrophota bacterium]MBU4488024.1 ribosomal RNA small subunit methyltransferase A [Candidatus Omnitrophota bacterium]MCG2704734.1 16S rRNA (adenine(1518)-N(6)/adenine(1519)-N(6))-dimethyltransferase RsmA [Candidatus Omnitrophota bacterium]
MLSKSEIKSLEKKFGFRPQKRLGQNFLIDTNIQKKILEAANLKKNDTVLEVGPGLGELTFDMSRSVKEVVAVEFDKKLFSILDALAGDFKNISIVHEDFLKYDIAGLSPPGGKIKIISNLPYCVSTPIILKLLRNKACIESALLTLQREVAERLTAEPKTKAYGSLTLFTAFQAEVKRLFNIKKNSFYPVPQVDSAVILLKPRREAPVQVDDEDLLLALIKTAFSSRRKTLANSLFAAGFKDLPKTTIQNILHKAGISENARAEELSLSDFARIANLF